jgi:hypothetical protein
MNKRFWGILLIFLIVTIAYGLTTQMYIWKDDHALMYVLINVKEGAGLFGKGIFDQSSAYRGVIALTYPIYKLFGVNPSAFFIEGLFFYFFASVCVYLFATTLARSKKIGLIASLIFASGYIGSETIWRIDNSAHTSCAIILACLSLTFYKKFIDYKANNLRKILFYIISLLLFAFAIEIGFVRIHGIIFFILGLEVFWNFNFILSLFRMIPFVFVYYFFYIASTLSGGEVTELISTIFIKQNFNYLLRPFQNLQNVIIPDVFGMPLFLFLVALFLILIFLKSKRKIFLFSIFFIIGSFAIYFVHTPDQILPSTSRLFTISFIGASILISVVLTKFFKNKTLYVGVGFIVILYLFLGISAEINFIKTSSAPEKKFYAALRKEVPSLAKGSALFFDIKDDPESHLDFANFFSVGSMSEGTAIAWQYGLDRTEVVRADTLNEVLSLLKAGKTTKDKIYTFFYDSKTGLINTSEMTKNSLFELSKKTTIADLGSINFPFSSPIKITFNLNATINGNKIKYIDGPSIDLDAYISYSESRADYYNNVKAIAQSDWQNERMINLADDDVDTLWMGNRIKWHNANFEEITVDLGGEENVGAVHLTYFSVTRSPKKYQYSCSIDGNKWTSIKYSHMSMPATSDLFDTFDSISCRYVKLRINDTYGGDAPEIAEIEVVDTKYKNIDVTIAKDFQNNPLKFLTSKQEIPMINKYLTLTGFYSSVCFYTDKSKTPFCQPIRIFPGNKSYSLIVPANGTILKSVNFVTSAEIDVNFSNGNIYPMKFENLEKAGYILNYVEI